jgi:thiosulfate reductase cytochrome b subunit
MMSFFKNMTNSKLLLIAVIAAFLALPFDLKFLSFMQSESIFMFLRLLSFILFMYVAIKVINGKTKKKTAGKK